MLVEINSYNMHDNLVDARIIEADEVYVNVEEQSVYYRIGDKEYYLHMYRDDGRSMYKTYTSSNVYTITVKINDNNSKIAIYRDKE